MEQTSNFVEGKVRKALLRAALICIVIAAIIIGIAVAAGVRPSTLTHPVTQLGLSTQVAGSRFKSGMIVSVTAPDVKDTGIYYTGDNNSRVGAIETKDGYLLVNIPSGKSSVFGQSNVKITGEVEKVSAALSQHVDSFASTVAQQQQWTSEQETAFRKAFPGVQLYYASSWQFLIGLAWAAVIIPALLLIFAISRLALLGTPERSGVWRRLVKKGSTPSATELAARLNEAAVNGTVKQVGKFLYFSPAVVGYFAGVYSQLHPLGDLVWIYPHVVRRRMYGIPTGSSWSVVLCFGDKRKANMVARNEGQAKEFIQEIQGVCPQVLSGYSADRQTKFNLGNMDALRHDSQGQTPPPVYLPGSSAPPPPVAAPGEAVTTETPYEQKQSYWGRGAILTSKTDKEVRKQMKAARKAKRGELDTRDRSAPPAGMEATAPPEETSFGLGDDDFGGDFK